MQSVRNGRISLSKCLSRYWPLEHQILTAKDSHYINVEQKSVPFRQFKGQPYTFDVALFEKHLREVHEADKTVKLPVYL
jgi:pantothenate kinase